MSEDHGSLIISDHVEARFGYALDGVAPGLSRVVVGVDRTRGDPTSGEIAFFSGDVFPERARSFLLEVVKAKGLRWLHTFSAGVDDPFFQGMRDRGIRLTTSSGAMASPIAQTVMLYLLSFSRDLRGWIDDQQRRVWRPRTFRDLQGQVLGVVGMGPIGREVARLGAAFGMHVVGMRRTPWGDEPCETWPLSRLRDLLERADALVLALPLNQDTRQIIDAPALDSMKPDAILVNVARGGLVDEAALATRLRDGRLGGAALDVFETEPLPESSPLWTLPNVIVTPHTSGTTPGNQDRVAAIFLENLERYLKGSQLQNEAEA